MNRALLVLVSTALVACLLSFGCGGDEELPEPTARDAAPSAEKPAAQATPASPTQGTPAPSPVIDEKARAEMADNLAERLTETVELPDYFPEDGPVYPGSKPSHVQQLPNGKVTVMFGTDASVEDAVRVMISAAEDQGWTIASEDQIERGSLTRATKGGRSATILTNSVKEPGTEGATLVAVSIDP